MDSKKVGSFIASMRKQKSLTQKELAEKLNVTNKAISKWETGKGYPEITIVPELAKVLGVTTAELLNGELNVKQVADNEEAATIINETVKYYDRDRMKKGNLIIAIIFIISVISSCICLLCNYLINNKFNWSLYVVGAFIVLWSVIMPISKLKRFRAMVSLGGFTVTLIPYLFLIQYLVPVKGWVIPLALPIVILSILSLGISLFIWFYTKINKFYSAAIIVLLFGTVYEMGIQKIIENFVKNPGANEISMIITVLSSIVIAAVLVAFEHIKKK